MTVITGAAREAAVAQPGIKLEILICNMPARKMVYCRDGGMNGCTRNFNRFEKAVFCRGPELDVTAVSSADLAKGGNIGAHNTTALKHCFNYGQTEAFDDGWRNKKLTMAIAPLQLRVSDPMKQNDVSGKPSSLNEAMDPRGFGSFDSYDDEQSCGTESTVSQQAMKDSEREQNVFIAPVLRDTEQKWLAVPTWHRALCRHWWTRFNTVVDRDCLLQPEPRSMNVELP